MNLSSEVLDEIALEGLDGITIEALWVRLLLRKGFLLPPKDEHSKLHIWNIVRRLKDVEFYQLEQPRQPLVVFDRWSNLEDDLGMVMEPDPIPVDIYPHCMVTDTVNKIQGSCPTYYTRENVTNTIRKLKLAEIFDKYGPERIVIVANQNARRVSLMGTHQNPQIELTDFQYCCLERVGRSRYHGEVTQGKMGLQVLGVDSKSIFYFRKFLLKQKLITKQLFHMKTNNVHTAGRLIHLPRFYRTVKPKFVTLTETIIDFLMTQPRYMCEVKKLKELLGIPGSLRKLIKLPEFQKYVRTDPRAPYRTLYPDADPKEWKQKNNDREKLLHVVFLVDPTFDTKEIKRKLEGNDEDEDDEDEDGETHSHGFLDQSTRCYDRTIVSQVWRTLEDAGPNGLSATELTRALSMARLNMRAVVKYMLRSKLIGSFMADVARQRVTRYVVNSGNRLCDVTAEFTSEELKLSNLTNADNNRLANVTDPKNNAGEGCSRNINETIVRQGDDNDNNDSRLPTVDEKRDENMEVVEEINVEQEKSEGGGVVVEMKGRIENVGEKEEGGDVGVEEKGSKEEVMERGEDEKNVESNLKKLRQSRSGRKRPKAEGKEAGVSTPKKSKLKVKTVLDLNKDIKIDDLLENVEKTVSEPMDVSMESSSSTTDPEMSATCESSVSGALKDDDRCKIEIVVTDDLNWLRTRGKLGKDCTEGYKTVKSLKRWNWILETVQTHKVISNLKNLHTVIDENEIVEGSNSRIDRKSLLRILYKMAVERLIKFYRVLLKSGDITQEMNFICSSSIPPDDPLIKCSIDLAKLKFSSRIKLQNDIATKQVNKPPPEPVIKEEMVLTNKFDFNEEHRSKMDVPKFMRMRYLHIFMYYLVYGYEGSVDLDQKEAAEQIRASQGFEVEDLESMSCIYVTSACWKMFVPPLPQHRDYDNGWCLLADVILRLPLSMFLHLVRLTYIIPNLDLYMDHPIKRHILVKDLPASIRNCLTLKRKYVFSIYEVVTRLAYIGLVQMGPQSFKDKDHVYVYLNKNALLSDTKPSGAGYHKVSEDIIYNETRYYFDSMNDVDRYWLDMWKICMHTKLGIRSCVIGTDLILENIKDKPEMVNILKARTQKEVVEKDIGYIPGDKLGAAGFDSALFSHLKRNWSFKPFPRARHTVLAIPDTITTHTKTKKPFKLAEGKNQMMYSLLAKRRKNLILAARKQSTTTPKSTLHRKQPLSRKTRVTVRHVKPKRHVSHRRPYYDQVDREALQRMNKLRVDWSKAEDKLLLLCKVVQTMISPHVKSTILGNMYVTTREMLHKTFPASRNKTSRACQRRINYMLRSQSTCHSLNLCIEELRHDANIMETYGDLFEKLKAKYENKNKVVENKAKLVAEWNMHFKNLFQLLAKRFDNFSVLSLSSVTWTIPDTLEEFHAQYKVIEPTKKVKPKHRFNPAESVNDVYCSVINSTIHSALCCSSDKTSWSYHLFSVYQQYPEKVLRSALAKMRTSLMVSLKRTWARSKMRSGNYLPLTASPYRLSISYINLMVAKYTFDIFVESYELMKTIAESKQVEVQTATGGTTAGILHLVTDDLVDFEIGIPDQVIVLNPNVQEKDEQYTRLMKRYQEILSSYKQELQTSSCLFQKDNYSTVNSIEDVNFDNSTVSNNTLARTASRIALYLVRDSEEVGGSVSQDLLHVHDFFVVNPATVVSILRSDLTEDQLKIITDMDDVQIFQKELKESVIFPGNLMMNLNENVVLRENFTGERFDNAVKLVELAKSEGNLGLLCGRIVKEFGNDRKVKQILDELCKLKLLVCTGVVHTTYVHHKHARPWLVHSYQNKRKDRESRIPMIGDIMDLGEEEEKIDEGERREDTLLEGEKQRMEGIVENISPKDKESDGFVLLFIGNDKEKMKEGTVGGEGKQKEKITVVDVVKPGKNSENKEKDDNVMEVDCEKVAQREEGNGGMEGGISERGTEEVEKEVLEDCRKEGLVEDNEECVMEGRNLVESTSGEEVKVQENKKERDKGLEKKDAVESTSGEEGKIQENMEKLVELLGEKNTVEGFGKSKEKEHKEEFDKDQGEEKTVVGNLEEEFDEGKETVDGSTWKEGIVRDDKQEFDKRLGETKPVESFMGENKPVEICLGENESVEICLGQEKLVESCSGEEELIDDSKECDKGLEGENSVKNTSGKVALAQELDKEVRKDNSVECASIMEILVQQDNKEQLGKESEQIIPAKDSSVGSFKDRNPGEGCSKDIVCDTEVENTGVELKNQGSSDKREHSDEECGSLNDRKRIRLDENSTSETSRKTRSNSKSGSLTTNEPSSSVNNGNDPDNRNLSNPIKILMRPWVKIDGSIHRRCLDYMLSTVLSHILLHPLSTLAELQERFLPALQPQHTRELAELLQNMKCIDSYICERVGKVTLFSKPCEVVVKKATGLEPASEIRYEADRDAIVNLGKLISTKQYNEGFLTVLIDK